jgi:NAD(P)H-hydrate epimerase
MGGCGGDRPGLGQQAWGKQALQKVENFRKPMLWDADALNLLAINPDKRHNRILTPHPGEAARLLNCSVAEIESDRLLSAQRLVKRYGGVAVLKGAGTVVASDETQGIIDAGNAGMASGGMGDVLSGIIGALLGQKLPFMMQPVRAAWPTVSRQINWLRVTVHAVCWPPIFLHAAACC